MSPLILHFFPAVKGSVADSATSNPDMFPYPQLITGHYMNYFNEGLEHDYELSSRPCADVVPRGISYFEYTITRHYGGVDIPDMKDAIRHADEYIPANKRIKTTFCIFGYDNCREQGPMARSICVRNYIMLCIPTATSSILDKLTIRKHLNALKQHIQVPPRTGTSDEVLAYKNGMQMLVRALQKLDDRLYVEYSKSGGILIPIHDRFSRPMPPPVDFELVYEEYEGTRARRNKLIDVAASEVYYAVNMMHSRFAATLREIKAICRVSVEDNIHKPIIRVIAKHMAALNPKYKVEIPTRRQFTFLKHFWNVKVGEEKDVSGKNRMYVPLTGTPFHSFLDTVDKF